LRHAQRGVLVCRWADQDRPVDSVGIHPRPAGGRPSPLT